MPTDPKLLLSVFLQTHFGAEYSMKIGWLSRLASSSPKYLFIFSLCLVSLLYGVEAGNREIFPQPQLREAKSAVKALIEVFGKDNEVAKDFTVESPTGPTIPTVKNHAGIDDGALILVSGGDGYLSEYNPNGCLAWLMDRKGEIKHIWKLDPNLWDDLERVSTIPGVSTFYPFGMQILPDGGLLATFQGLDTWPYAIGMVRLDKNSNVIWKKECFAHHYFILAPERKIITPALRILEGAQPIGLTRGRINGDHGNGKVYEDMITVMSLDGEILEEVSMLDVVHNSGLIGLYQGAYSRRPDVDTSDPLHLNCVELIGERVAAAHDWLNADDFLVSFRGTNAIAIIDRPTLRIKWYMAGATLRQHSPRFFGTEKILVFDNFGGDESLGGTRLAQIGLENRKLKTIFPTQESVLESKVFSESCGYLDLNRNESAVLMAVTRQDTLFEIDPDSGEILWEYQYADTSGENRPLFTAKYCYDVAFDMNQVEETE
jgi:hypothetical protein